jgi:predicted alpha/beta-hydrolase family hydrolase
MLRVDPQLKITTTEFEASPDSGEVSGILMMPVNPQWLLVFAHGAGAGMRHPFMEAMAKRLAGSGIGTFRYQFPYMEQTQKRPDSKPILLATVQSAVNTAREHAKGIPLFAGGKSMGGRMTSNAAAEGLLPDVRGIVFFGFPLHPPNQPDRWKERSEHLNHVKVPMLFLQGTRDSFAGLKLLRPVCKELGKRATLHLIEGGDHSFRVPKSVGRTDSDVFDELTRTVVDWAEKIQ